MGKRSVDQVGVDLFLHGVITMVFFGLEQGVGAVGVDFGSVSLCHVAAGFTDATIEFAKGFAVWDLAPGHYILHAAGGVVLDLEGRPLPLDYQFGSMADINEAMDRRQMFVAASSLVLARDIVASIDAT